MGSVVCAERVERSDDGATILPPFGCDFATGGANITALHCCARTVLNNAQASRTASECYDMASENTWELTDAERLSALQRVEHLTCNPARQSAASD
ncbi:hypothetical protein BOO86_01345 [Mycobacterium sp. CBMA 234]|nr:hypothetical protein [Mycolicibacterium sp. CBMA 234]